LLFLDSIEMDKEKKEEIKKLIEKISDLEYEISSWGATNSQSNPGAVMNLRWMKKEVQKLRQKLSEYKIQ
jgi:hypothetical protein